MTCAISSTACTRTICTPARTAAVTAAAVLQSRCDPHRVACARPPVKLDNPGMQQSRQALLQLRHVLCNIQADGVHIADGLIAAFASFGDGVQTVRRASRRVRGATDRLGD